MPGKDATAWTQNEDGSWSRIRGENEERTYVDPTTSAEVEEDDEDEFNATGGAVEAAAELGVDLAEVVGSGAEGRITKADVEAAAKED